MSRWRARVPVALALALALTGCTHDAPSASPSATPSERPLPTTNDDLLAELRGLSVSLPAQPSGSAGDHARLEQCLRLGKLVDVATTKLTHALRTNEIPQLLLANDLCPTNANGAGAELKLMFENHADG